MNQTGLEVRHVFEKAETHGRNNGLDESTALVFAKDRLLV